MADLDLVITNAGRAALINAANNGTAAVVIAACGVSEAPVVPTPTATTLPGELKRLSTIAGDVVADDTIHVLIRDESAGVYTLRSFALYLDDGTLFAIYGQAAPIMEKSAGAMLLMAVDAQFVDVDVSHLTFGDTNFLNPSATTEVEGVIEIATEAEAKAGSDTRRALTPKTARAALLNWLLAQDGAGSGVDADLLDGLHATSFMRAISSHLYAAYAVDVAKAGWYGLLHGTTPSHMATMFHDDGKGGWWSSPVGWRVYWDGTNLHIGGQNSKVWHAGNDGAGSGLDADLLDGQQGSYYLPAGSYTAADVRAKLLSVDGSGSGLDADLLDGLHATSFMRALSSSHPYAAYAIDVAKLGWYGLLHGTTTSHMATVFHDDRKGGWYSGADGWRVYYDGTNLHIGGQNSKVWHAGNDGAGTGLDADLLDGYQGSYYLPAASYTAADVRAKLLTVDGAGTGLDADLLDGLQATAFLRETAAHVYATYSIDKLKGGYYGILHGTDRTHIASMFTADGIGGWYRQSDAKWLACWDGKDLHIGAGSNQKAWHAGNDGAGSGLDADLLDGLHATSFMRAISSHLYAAYAVDVAKAGWYGLLHGTSTSHMATMFHEDGKGGWWSTPEGWRVYWDGTNLHIGGQNSKVWHAGNDGAGSGLDADLLDGQQGSYYLPAGSYTAADVRAKLLTVDGAGSGLDADLLDGQHASAFALASAFSGSLGASGWQRLSGGLIMQWGTLTVASDSYATLTFPTAFSEAIYLVNAAVATEVGNGNAQANGPLPIKGSETLTGCQFFNAAPASTTWWFALGK